MNTKIVSSIKINLIIFLVSTLMVSAGNLFAADDVVHWWVGDAESKALKVIVDEFENSDLDDIDNNDIQGVDDNCNFFFFLQFF